MRRLGNWLDSYMEYTFDTEPSPLYHRWSGISIVASVMQRKCWTNNGGIMIYPNFYTVLVGPSSARKGTAMKYATDMLKASDVFVNMAPKTTTREMMIKVLAAAVVQSSVEDDKILFHNSLTVHSTELTVFLGQKNFQFIQDLTDWWDCLDDWDYQTKASGTYSIHNIYVNLLGAITPELIQSALPMEAIVGGLTQRMILVYAPRKFKTVPAPLLPEKLKIALIHDLAEIHAISGEFKVTPDFMEMYAGWYVQQDTEHPLMDRRFNGYTGRRQIFMWKIAMVCCICRTDSRVMDVCDFEKALEILTEVEKPMSNALNGVGASPLSSPLHGVIAALQYKRDMTKGELMAIFHNDVTSEELEEILHMLYIEGHIEIVNGERIQFRGNSF